MTAGPYSIGSDTFPGLSKLVEEQGELQQVLGKILGAEGLSHWTGDLGEPLAGEMGDVLAALMFFGAVNNLDRDRIFSRAQAKYNLFMEWHRQEGGEPPDVPWLVTQ